jgi:hypothetical protein
MSFQLFLSEISTYINHFRVLNSPLPLITCAELADVYDLAMRWQMTHMCEVIMKSVIASFNDDYAVRKLYLAKRLNHNDWIIPAIHRIIRRSKTLDSEEIDILDSKTAATLLDLRERFRMEVIVRYHGPARESSGEWFNETAFSYQVRSSVKNLEGSLLGRTSKYADEDEEELTLS